ncbi:Piwi domain-domain-containing protein [Clohesyomyces aquaticus]|uniref:Piwi domain-domain-containing protein n=1 Tax=Clohesyomyces aquaticus TaxID=1231657 RepID=A0A1Y1YNJ5_9PLEO|nr:Piwi domain-domain-containing protein [Clohesyomyces aquaticus]
MDKTAAENFFQVEVTRIKKRENKAPQSNQNKDNRNFGQSGQQQQYNQQRPDSNIGPQKTYHEGHRPQNQDSDQQQRHGGSQNPYTRKNQNGSGGVKSRAPNAQNITSTTKGEDQPVQSPGGPGTPSAEDPSIGEAVKSVLDTRIRDPPSTIAHGIYKPQTTFVGPKIPPGGLEVLTNYVKVNKIPKNLFVYSLSYWRPRPGSTNPISFNKHSEIKGAFEALMAADALGLSSMTGWATDYKDLYCIIARQSPTASINAIWDTQTVTYTTQNGTVVDDMRATVTFTKALTGIDEAFKNKELSELSEYIRALNANVAQFVRQYSQASNVPLTQVGANKFFVNGGHNRMNGLWAVRGYFSSIRPGKEGVLLNVNTATSAFLPPILVSEILSIFRTGPVYESQEFVEKTLQNQMVRIIYKRFNSKKNKEKGIDINDEPHRLKQFQSFGLTAQQQRFYQVSKRSDGTFVSDPDDFGTTVWNHFMRNNVNLNGKSFNDLLCVNVGKKINMKEVDRIVGATCPSRKNEVRMRTLCEKGAIWVPACMLEIVPYQPVKGLLSARHTADMIDHALRLPGPNAELIDKEGLNLLGIKVSSAQAAQKKLGTVGFEVDTQLIRLGARTLPVPNLSYRVPWPKESEDLKSVSVRKDQAAWDLKDVRFARSAGMQELHVLGLNGCVRNGNPQERLVKLRNGLLSKLEAHGVGARPGYVSMQTSNDIDTELRNWFKECNPNDSTFILLKVKDYDIYSTIKRAADFRGHHTLCAVAGKIKDGSFAMEQHMSNLALKVNMKLAGDNHHLDSIQLDKLLGAERRSKTIILGADVAHPNPGGANGNPSIACVVGSVDKEFMMYPGSMRLQAGSQEQIDSVHLASMVSERLRAWKAKNNDQLPQNMLFYRDGVSESQFQLCIDSEIPAIKRAYSLLGGDPSTFSLTFLITAKRHHTRFYAVDSKDTYTQKTFNRTTQQSSAIINGNLKPGLLVENVVTNPSPHSFFLQSHCAIKGTARSAHYHVLLDEMALSPTKIPDLTHMLCYAFPRATKGVSYVAPAYIADRLCERGRSYLRVWNKGPGFKGPEDEDKEKGSKASKEEVLAWKREKAMELSRKIDVWGPNYNDDPAKGPVRLNPWHPNLDDGMFWM